MFYKIMNKISDTELMDGARDYRLMTRQFVNALLELKEYNRFSKGLFGWVGFKTKWIEFENVERKEMAAGSEQPAAEQVQNPVQDGNCVMPQDPEQKTAETQNGQQGSDNGQGPAEL